MRIVKNTPADNGAYGPIQDWSGRTLPEGYCQWPDYLSTDDFYAYSGFVVLTIVRNLVTGYAPNTEAWEDWKASQPEPEPEPEPETPVTWDELAGAIREGVNSL